MRSLSDLFSTQKVLSWLLRQAALNISNPLKKRVAKQTYLEIQGPFIILDARTSSLDMVGENKEEGLSPTDNPIGVGVSLECSALLDGGVISGAQMKLQ